MRLFGDLLYVGAALLNRRTVIVEEYGALGNNKATQLNNAKNVFRNNGVSQMVWEITRPGKGAADLCALPTAFARRSDLMTAQRGLG